MEWGLLREWSCSEVPNRRLRDYQAAFRSRQWLRLTKETDPSYFEDVSGKTRYPLHSKRGSGCRIEKNSWLENYWYAY
jgi:hypothetical protein